MIPRDHHHPDPGPLGFGHRCRRLGSRGIDHPHHPQVHQLGLDRLVGRRLRVIERPVGHRQGAQGQVPETRRRGLDLGPSRLGEAPRLTRHPFVGAAPEKHVRRSLGDHVHLAVAVVVAFQARHQLPLRSERDLTHPPEPALPLDGEPHLGLGDQEGGLGGIALDGPPSPGLQQAGVVGEAPPHQDCRHLLPEDWVLEGVAVVTQFAVGLVARAADGDLARGGHHPLDRHLAPGQGSGLVGADHRGGAQGLHR